CLLECRAEAGQVLSEVVLRSPLLRDPETGAGPRSMGAGEGSTSVGAMNDFGVDPNTDPELYMALQLSLQEEQNRTARLQEQAAPSAAEEARGTEPTATNGSGADASGVPTVAQIEMMEDIDDELRQALLLSLQDYSGQPASQEAEMSEAAPAEQRGEQAETPVEAPKEEKREQPGDSELAQVLGSLPGVDVSDPRLQEVLREAASSPDEEAKETEKNNEGS
ncbi:ubiquitin interaction motif family protein, partial [Toxoplasma gondii RUB]